MMFNATDFEKLTESEAFKRQLNAVESRKIEGVASSDIAKSLGSDSQDGRVTENDDSTDSETGTAIMGSDMVAEDSVDEELSENYATEGSAEDIRSTENADEARENEASAEGEGDSQADDTIEDAEAEGRSDNESVEGVDDEESSDDDNEDEKALPHIVAYGKSKDRRNDGEADEQAEIVGEGTERDAKEENDEQPSEEREIKREKKKVSTRKAKAKKSLKFNKKKLVIAIFAIAVLLILYFVLQGAGASGKLKDAKEAEAKGEYAKAAKLYNSIEDSEESKERLKDLVKKRPELSVYNCKEGDSILFGSIDQDGNTNNGREPIEWIVLEKSGTEALLISKYCLDLKPFSDEGETDASWEGSVMRRWLNTNFYNDIFTLDERDLVADTRKSGDDIVVDASAGKSTDKVFLLDAKQVEKYFPTEDDRRCALTQSAKKNANISGDDAMSWWWLCARDGKKTEMVSMVDATGTLNVDMEVSPDNKGGVRPVIMIGLVP